MQDKNITLYLPGKTDLPLSIENLRQWYSNLSKEIAYVGYTADDMAILKDKHNYYGKFYSDNSREFFLNHFATNLALAVNYLFCLDEKNPRILEIGSGCGNQLLLMALLGADVVGCDIGKEVCGVAKIRKVYYENVSQRTLNISIVCNDVFTVNWDEWGEFDGLIFQFSLNIIKPNELILQLAGKLLRNGGRIAIHETNQSNYYNRVFRRRDSMTPREVAQAFEHYNFRIHSLKGGYVIPPPLWRTVPRSILSPVDQFLCRSLFMSPSYHLMAEKL